MQHEGISIASKLCDDEWHSLCHKARHERHVPLHLRRPLVLALVALEEAAVAAKAALVYAAAYTLELVVSLLLYFGQEPVR